MENAHENLKTIWFEDEMLPNWAQLLDVAARLCPVGEETQSWFARFTNASGVDDARKVTTQSEILQNALRENRTTLISQLQTSREDGEAARIVAAWEYALGTIIQVAAAKKTCSWKVEGVEDPVAGDFGDGDITLRRV